MTEGVGGGGGGVGVGVREEEVRENMARERRSIFTSTSPWSSSTSSSYANVNGGDVSVILLVCP